MLVDPAHAVGAAPTPSRYRASVVRLFLSSWQAVVAHAATRGQAEASGWLVAWWCWLIGHHSVWCTPTCCCHQALGLPSSHSTATSTFRVPPASNPHLPKAPRATGYSGLRVGPQRVPAAAGRVGGLRYRQAKRSSGGGAQGRMQRAARRGGVCSYGTRAWGSSGQQGTEHINTIYKAIRYRCRRRAEPGAPGRTPAAARLAAPIPSFAAGLIHCLWQPAHRRSLVVQLRGARAAHGSRRRCVRRNQGLWKAQASRASCAASPRGHSASRTGAPKRPL